MPAFSNPHLAVVPYDPRASRAGVTSHSAGTALKDQFDEFFELLVHLKALVENGGWERNKDAIFKAKLGAITPDEFVRQTLADLLNRQERLNSQQYGVFASSLSRENQYAMAALADEVMLNLNWPGAHGWNQNLLEEVLFQTRVAGERIFDQIEVVLVGRDVTHRDLAVVYLRLLGCGFEGKYRGKDAVRILAEYRYRLYVFIRGGPPNTSDRNWHLMPSAFSNVYEAGNIRFLRSRKIWLLIPTGVLLAGLIVSTVLWYKIKPPLEESARLVLQELPGK